MSRSIRGRNHRVPADRLSKFLLASGQADAVKASVAAAVRELGALWADDPDAVIPPAMLVSLNRLIGCETTETIDLLRVLLRLRPHLRAHRAQNLAALLRGKQAKLDRPITGADFPTGHRIHLFASAYWGGVDAWGAGASCRKQRPKGHWLIRANQIEALRSFATAHPQLPITHSNLHVVGLHRLAMILTATELDALATEAGLVRALLHQPDQAGRWTREVVISKYVTLCLQWGVTLSSHALVAIGGEASSVRLHARRVFGRFGAMVDAAVQDHFEVAPPTRFAARDGTRLDSQSEVVVWNALRAGLPHVEMAAHVVLAGEARRSADMVLAGHVYVEVTMVARADMAEPHNAKVAAYARKWASKQAVYDRLGIRPVVFEPADVFDPARTAARVADVAALLSTTAIPAASSGKTTRAKGHWDFDALCAAVSEVAEAEQTGGVFPTNLQIAARAYGHAVNLLKPAGMRARVAAKLGLTIKHARNIWTRDRVVAGLVAWCGQTGRYPTASDALPAGLASARHRLWAGAQCALRDAVQAKLTVVMPPGRAPNGSHATLESVARILEPLARKLKRMPTYAEYRALGLNSAWSAASRTWGIARVAEFLAVEHGRRRERKKRGEARNMEGGGCG